MEYHFIQSRNKANGGSIPTSSPPYIFDVLVIGQNVDFLKVYVSKIKNASKLAVDFLISQVMTVLTGEDLIGPQFKSMGNKNSD